MTSFGHNSVSDHRLLDCLMKYSGTCVINWNRIAHVLATEQTSHYSDVIMGAMASKITSLMIVYSTVYSGADQIKYQSSASLAVRGIHRWPVNFTHTWPLTRNFFPFYDVIMRSYKMRIGVYSCLKNSRDYVYYGTWKKQVLTIKGQYEG